MAFDIYGNRLTPGHCEVHPNEREEYPCSLCRPEPTPEEPWPDYYSWYYEEIEFRWRSWAYLTLGEEGGDDG